MLTTATPPATLSLTGDCVRREVECWCLHAGSSEELAMLLIGNADIFLAPSSSHQCDSYPRLTIAHLRRALIYTCRILGENS
jgi:hypothetical protein